MSEVTRIKEEIKDIEKLIEIFNKYPNNNRIIKKLEQQKKSLKLTYKMINPCPKKPIEKFCNPINYTK